MFRIQKTMVISCKHNLNLDYDSPCICEHGHNYKIKIGLVGNRLNKYGMLFDFAHIKKIVNRFDHADLNELMEENPTAENMCFYFFQIINEELERHYGNTDVDVRVEYVKIWETPDSWAQYIDKEAADELE